MLYKIKCRYYVLKRNFILMSKTDFICNNIVTTNMTTLQQTRHTLITLSMRKSSVDSDQTHYNARTNQGVHCLPFTWQFYIHQKVVNWYCLNFRTSMVRCYGV